MLCGVGCLLHHCFGIGVAELRTHTHTHTHTQTQISERVDCGWGRPVGGTFGRDQTWPARTSSSHARPASERAAPMRIAVCAVWVSTSITHSLPPPSQSPTQVRDLWGRRVGLYAPTAGQDRCVSQGRGRRYSWRVVVVVVIPCCCCCTCFAHCVRVYVRFLVRSVPLRMSPYPGTVVGLVGCWHWIGYRPSVRPSTFRRRTVRKRSCILCAALVVIVVVVVVNGPGSGTGYCGVCRSICSSASRSAVFVHVCSIRCAFLRLAPVCRVHLVKYLGTFLLLGDILCLGVFYIRPCRKKIQGFK
ncbi:uncharacterized protein LOC121601254 [Anopheles merus]|uniref:uncharacterized protein LOC121601254 n=1 Tax=Anopheles merus TaxID=30066 RepID=UPI001BE48AB9|nr:uncharacterized protein LOC121601254 [Anopheles merus]